MTSSEPLEAAAQPSLQPTAAAACGNDSAVLAAARTRQGQQQQQQQAGSDMAVELQTVPAAAHLSLGGFSACQAGPSRPGVYCNPQTLGLQPYGSSNDAAEFMAAMLGGSSTARQQCGSHRSSSSGEAEPAGSSSAIALAAAAAAAAAVAAGGSSSPISLPSAPSDNMYAACMLGSPTTGRTGSLTISRESSQALTDSAAAAAGGSSAAAGSSGGDGDGSGGGELPLLARELGVSMHSLERLFRADADAEYEQPVWMVVNLQGKIKGSYTAEKMLEFCRRGTLSTAQLVLGIDKNLPYIARQELAFYRTLGQLIVAVHNGAVYRPLTEATMNAIADSNASPANWSPLVEPSDPGALTRGLTSGPAAGGLTGSSLAADMSVLSLSSGDGGSGGNSNSGGDSSGDGANASINSSEGRVVAAAAAARLRSALQRLCGVGSQCGRVGAGSKQPLWLYINHLGWCRGPFSGGKVMHAHLCGRLPRNTLVVAYDPEVPACMISGDVAQWFRPLGALLDNVANGWTYNTVKWADVVQRGAFTTAQAGWEPLVYLGPGSPPPLLAADQLAPPSTPAAAASAGTTVGSSRQMTRAAAATAAMGDAGAMRMRHMPAAAAMGGQVGPTPGGGVVMMPGHQQQQQMLWQQQQQHMLQPSGAYSMQGGAAADYMQQQQQQPMMGNMMMMIHHHQQQQQLLAQQQQRAVTIPPGAMLVSCDSGSYNSSSSSSNINSHTLAQQGAAGSNTASPNNMGALGRSAGEQYAAYGGTAAASSAAAAGIMMSPLQMVNPLQMVPTAWWQQQQQTVGMLAGSSNSGAFSGAGAGSSEPVGGGGVYVVMHSTQNPVNNSLAGFSNDVSGPMVMSSSGQHAEQAVSSPGNIMHYSQQQQQQQYNSTDSTNMHSGNDFASSHMGAFGSYIPSAQMPLGGAADGSGSTSGAMSSPAVSAGMLMLMQQQQQNSPSQQQQQQQQQWLLDTANRGGSMAPPGSRAMYG